MQSVRHLRSSLMGISERARGSRAAQVRQEGFLKKGGLENGGCPNLRAGPQGQKGGEMTRDSALPVHIAERGGRRSRRLK